jgi:hypothetical protein
MISRNTNTPINKITTTTNPITSFLTIEELRGAFLIPGARNQERGVAGDAQLAAGTAHELWTVRLSTQPALAAMNQASRLEHFSRRWSGVAHGFVELSSLDHKAPTKRIRPSDKTPACHQDKYDYRWDSFSYFASTSNHALRLPLYAPAKSNVLSS